ncbi:cAMP-binding domain of CRP or a regulatory subunit of cAMP-dependent protein kinases [Lutibacter agarilyticus]|uniref:cAMP-binding domain of CRP or a regulatory subunit of cAMP-dependent protein kinases n=1 Tax=Lutibacter agarilyticus TaxID=1109740 RepID=A0A238XV19_9FLAO|nr:Crp/Fnr family transcriptional regulator [Lutibacter agarilyticus]SNR62371.1 cAMP-binding domain of CRP or a regulatory subunit of cAMP-dependent protein kinases [Lutibacter agarilyticus]
MVLKNKISCELCSNEKCIIKQSLSSELLQELAKEKNTLISKKGQHFILEGTPVNGLFFIQKGKAKVLKTGIYGKEQILRFVTDGEIIGHRGFAISKNYSISASSIEDTVLCNFSNETLKKMLHTIPSLTYEFMLFYAEELNRSETKVKTIAQMTVREKVIDSLLYIHRKFKENPKGFINIQLSRKEIADFAGTTEEQVIRTISFLKKDKLIQTQGKKIKISDLINLRKEISEHNYFIDS